MTDPKVRLAIYIAEKEIRMFEERLYQTKCGHSLQQRNVRRTKARINAINASISRRKDLVRDLLYGI